MNFQGGDVLYSFVDLHNHCLYGIDDGANDTSMMESMLNIAYKDGIKVICLTPHFKIYKFNDEDEIDEYNSIISHRFQKALDYAKSTFPDMTLLIGNEIMYHNDICDSISSLHCAKIGNGSHVLVEFSPHVSEYDLKNGLLKLLRKGYKPILAHFERYECIIKKPTLLHEIKELGATIQINSNSVLKFGFGKVVKLIKWALRKQLVDIVCTDAHNDTTISPNLSKAHNKVLKKYGEEYAKKIFHDNQIYILKLNNIN